MILAAELSDTHFDLSARNTERVEAVMGYLADLPRRPDVILVTRDITDSGTPEQYAQARLALRGGDIPVYLLPNNDDDRVNFRTVLLGEPASTTPVNSVHRVGPLTVIMLDSRVPANRPACWARTPSTGCARRSPRRPTGPSWLPCTTHPNGCSVPWWMSSRSPIPADWPPSWQAIHALSASSPATPTPPSRRPSRANP